MSDFAVKCLETGETVVIKKVLQSKRYKDCELQVMRLPDHPNVVLLRHCFFSTTAREELYVNLDLEYIPETLHGVIKHYNRIHRHVPLICANLYMHQVSTIFFMQGSQIVANQYMISPHLRSTAFEARLTSIFLTSFIPDARLPDDFCCLFSTSGLLKGMQMEIIAKLIHKHTRSQCPFLGLLAYHSISNQHASCYCQKEPR